MEVTFIYGKPGTGKSYYVQNTVPPQDLFWYSPQSSASFFDGYEGQPAIVLDDFIGSHIARNHLYRILDSYPLRLPTKHGSQVARYTKVFITSNYWITQWYQNPDFLWALRRRVHVVMFKQSIDTEARVFRPTTLIEWEDLDRRAM